jgi:hypothetical protein
MSDTEQQVPKPAEKYHDAKKRFDNEIKLLTKNAKGKTGKEAISQKEKECEEDLLKIKKHWDLFNRQENGEDVYKEYEIFAGIVTVEVNNTPIQGNNGNNGIMGQQRELTKAQKKKLEKEEKEENEDKKRAELIKSLPDLSKDECIKINKKLLKYQFDGSLSDVIGAKYSEVPGDGNCLFRAIRQQLHFWAHNNNNNNNYNQSKDERNIFSTWLQPLPIDFLTNLRTKYKLSFDKNYKEFDIQHLRIMAACWISTHPDDYLPFLFQNDTLMTKYGGNGDNSSDNIVENYCKALISTENILWGGDCEINAFSSIFSTQINVIQAKGQHNHIFNPGKKHHSPYIGVLTIVFHEYWTSAGAHYNGIELNTPQQ